ncbi:hydrogenase nickel incorporation protein HypB [Candidatus Fermentibacteria bacterium]|nr:hydrogenase nickel incorporation protein HypB [Candidatus Fermentibacteria bacterium]
MSEKKKRKVQIRSPVMQKNDRIAQGNRALLDRAGLTCLNLMSSPGAGKTTILEGLAGRLGDRMAVIEGDVQTRRDADRVRSAGAQAWQIETRGACHLDAEVVSGVLEEMGLPRSPWRFLFIENVGNLICPSGFYLGEHVTIGMLSVPEGDDKILKYPALFSKIDLLLLNKADLLPHIEFDVERAVGECRSLNSDVDVITLSALTGEGLDELQDYIERAAEERFPTGG